MAGPKIARIGAAWVVAGAAWSFSASAQDFSGNVVDVPCCTCTDGSVLTVNLNTGAAPWRVVAPNGSSAMAVKVPEAQTSGWTVAGPASWIRHPSFQGPGRYSYEVRMAMRRCVIPARITVGGLFAADDGGSLQIDNNPNIGTDPVLGFRTPVAVPWTRLKQGNHVIRVRVNNQSGLTGFLLKAAVTVRCPSYAHVIEPIAVPGDH